MIRFLILTFASLILCMTSVSCGPEKSSEDLRNDTRDEERESQEKLERDELTRLAGARMAVIDQILGEFEGRYTFRDERGRNREVKVVLMLEYLEVVVPISNSSESFDMPSIRGRVTELNSGTVTRLGVAEFVESASEFRMSNSGGRFQLDIRPGTGGRLNAHLFMPAVPLDIDIVFSRKD